MRAVIHALTGLLLGVLLILPVAAQSYPVKAVKLIVPFPPGGATDQLARLLCEGLSRRMGQPFVIDNRPGAGGNLAAELAARAVPDGYTLLIAPLSIYAIAASLYPKLNYDLARDFAPVSTLINAAHLLVVNAALPVRSLDDLLRHGRARADGWTLASQGSGTVSHLEGEMLSSRTQLKLLHVPYRGSAPAIQDLVGGQVDVMFDSIASALPHVRGGKLRAVAVTGKSRSPLLPEVPTMEQAGLPGFIAESWLGLLTPAGTPPAIVQRLHKEVQSVLADTRTRSRLQDLGFETHGSTPDECLKRFRDEYVKWRPIVKASGAQVD